MPSLPDNQKPVFHVGGALQNQQGLTRIPSDYDNSTYKVNVGSAQSGSTFIAIQESNNRNISSNFVLTNLKQNIKNTPTCFGTSTGTVHPDSPCVVCFNGVWKHMSQIDPCYAYFPANGICQALIAHNECYDCKPTYRRINPITNFEEKLDDPIADLTFKCKDCETCSSGGSCKDNCPKGWTCSPKFNDSDSSTSYECMFKCSDSSQCDRNDCEVCDNGVCKYACYSGQTCENGQCVDDCNPVCNENDCEYCRLNAETNAVECISYCLDGQICCKGECYNNNCTCGSIFDNEACQCGPDQCPEGFVCLGDSNDPNSVCVETDADTCTYIDNNGVRQPGCDPEVPCNECYTLYSSEYDPPLMFSICRQCPADTVCYENSCVPTNDLECEIPCHAPTFDINKCPPSSSNSSNSDCYTCKDLCSKLGPDFTCYDGTCQEVYDITQLAMFGVDFVP